MSKELFVFELGDIVDCCKLKRLVSAIHYRKQDIWEGNIFDRIEEFSYYQLRDIPIQMIEDYQESSRKPPDLSVGSCQNHYETDAEMVDDYATRDYQEMPPIILHPDGDDVNQYWLVDGGHRAQACVKRGQTSIKAFIGIPRD